MSDPNTGAARRSLSRTILSGAWFSQYSRSLTGRHEGLQALVLGCRGQPHFIRSFLTCATPAYETNDDLMMQLIASGFYTGHPDAHLVFTNILIGWVLQFLYQTWAGCNWYLIYILVVHFAALTAIAFLVMARRFGWLSGLLYVGFFLVAETHILLHLQFTTTAFLAGTAGLLLMVDGLQMGNPVNWPRVITGISFGDAHVFDSGACRAVIRGDCLSVFY